MASVERRLTREDKPELVACHEHPVTLGQATALYVLATLVLTWPTITGLTSDIPWDLGDSLLNCWILGWDSDHLLRFFGGTKRFPALGVVARLARSLDAALGTIAWCASGHAAVGPWVLCGRIGRVRLAVARTGTANHGHPDARPRFVPVFL